MDTKLRSINLATVSGKKDDPSYGVVRGHVPIELHKRFKIFCVERGVDNSEGLEALLREYFESKDSQQKDLPAPSPTPAPKAKRGKAS